MLYSLDRGGKCNFFNGTCFLANEDYFCDCLLFKYVNAHKCCDCLMDLVFIGQLGYLSIFCIFRYNKACKSSKIILLILNYLNMRETYLCSTIHTISCYFWIFLFLSFKVLLYNAFSVVKVDVFQTKCEFIFIQLGS